MRKLQLHIALFLFPVLLLLAIIPVDKRLTWLGLRADCFHHALLHYDRLFVREKPIDILILGSSRAINGVDDKLMENLLKPDTFHVYNLAYCRNGRNLHYVLLKEVLLKHKPSHLFLEITEVENPYTHPVFPMMAPTQDVLFAELLFNKDWFSDIFTHGTYKLALWQDALYGQAPPPTHEDTDWGHAGMPGNTNREELLQVLQNKKTDTTQHTTKDRWFYNRYPMAYHHKIVELCRQNNIQIHYLYLRSFASQQLKPNEYDIFTQWGEVLLPPQTIIENPDLWYDREHLNTEGADVLTAWIMENFTNNTNAGKK